MACSWNIVNKTSQFWWTWDFYLLDKTLLTKLSFVCSHFLFLSYSLYMTWSQGFVCLFVCFYAPGIFLNFPAPYKVPNNHSSFKTKLSSLLFKQNWLFFLEPLQYSFLENPMDGGPWWATVYGVAKIQPTTE